MTKKTIDLSTLSEDELLSLRICELPITITGTWLEECVVELYEELEDNEISFKPDCYLADEWLTPDQEPIIGIAFYLADPALMRLERKMMLDVEGGTRHWCMQLLRHEAGHAFNYAYKFHRRKKWRETFGSFSAEYSETYRFRPYSKNFVRHLEDYYAQYHPDEDFAETFAVWLTPHLDWEAKYKGWPVLKKLRYVDELMREIKNKSALIARGKKYWQIEKKKSTLKNFYRKRKKASAEDFPDFHDVNLKKIFIQQDSSSLDPKHHDMLTAAEIIKKHRRNIINNVSLWTGERKYIIDELVKTLGKRSKALCLLSDADEPVAVSKISIYITTLIMNYRYTGWFRGDK